MRDWENLFYFFSQAISPVSSTKSDQPPVANVSISNAPPKPSAPARSTSPTPPRSSSPTAKVKSEVAISHGVSGSMSAKDSSNELYKEYQRQKQRVQEQLELQVLHWCVYFVFLHNLDKNYLQNQVVYHSFIIYYC